MWAQIIGSRLTEGLGGKRKVRANGEKGRITVINQKLKIFFKKVQKKIM